MKPEEFNYITAKRNRKGHLIPAQPVVRTPQFPGVNPGMDIEQVRQVIRNQKRTKGFSFDIEAGASNNFDIALSGTARLFLGFSLAPAVGAIEANAPDQFTLVINNEIVIEQVFPEFFGADFMDDEYYFLPRPLSGQDTITATFNGVNSFTQKLIVYYI